jgi:putative glycosyltransferase (TIGR04348 family)
MPTPRVQIVCPAKPGTRFGNRISALRWQRILRDLGCSVRIVDVYRSGACDLLLALHAKRSASSVVGFRAKHPHAPIILAITGTDLYGDMASDPEVKQALSAATRVVVLQSTALNELTSVNRRKTRVIHQSVPRLALQRSADSREHHVIVAGHLRAVKDPLRTAMAVRNLPRESRIVVHHYGAIIDADLGIRARREMKTNARYRWCGEVRRSTLRQVLARGWLMVLSSKLEGGANVLSEAISAELPVLSSSIPGSIGILGCDYAGYFDVGSTRELRELLLRAEQEITFYRGLQEQIRSRSFIVDPAREVEAWRSLLSELGY